LGTNIQRALLVSPMFILESLLLERSLSSVLLVYVFKDGVPAPLYQLVGVSHLAPVGESPARYIADSSVSKSLLRHLLCRRIFSILHPHLFNSTPSYEVSFSFLPPFSRPLSSGGLRQPVDMCNFPEAQRRLLQWLHGQVCGGALWLRPGY
jgi:hypothetical protein